MVSEELKELLESFVQDDPNIEFLPVKAISAEYGDRIYYILHFRKIYDVIDKKNTIYVEGTDSIIKLRVDYEKTKNLKIFNSQPAINDIIVSADIRRAIRKNKLNLGLIFMPIYCMNGQ